VKPSDRQALQVWLLNALNALGGAGAIAQICEEVWTVHEVELRSSGTLFYTWQYDIRWLATKLRQRGVLKPANSSPRGVWELEEKAGS
jgi:hypothetical protein